MVNLIYNISPTANDCKQHKDNNNNIIKDLGLKKDIMFIREELRNLMEALTNNAIDTVEAFLLLPFPHYH